MISKLKKIFNENKGPSKIEWIIFLIAAAIVFFVFIYDDIQYTLTHTLNYSRAIIQGNALGLYSYNFGSVINGNLTNVCYDFPIYFIFMLWNLPSFIIYNFIKYDVAHNFLSLIWVKLLLVFFLVASCIVITKICKELSLKKEKIKWVIFVFVSSPLVFSSLYFMAQYDIIPLFFVLLGILYYIKGDTKKFILWFAIAIPLKIFAIFAFIPLLLLKEKKIMKLMLKTFLALIPLLLSKVIQSIMPMYSESVSVFNDTMYDKLINTSSISVGIGVVSLFVIAYGVICFLAYKNDKKEHFNYNAIYIPLAVYSLMFLLIGAHPYWLIYITPFLAIIFFKNQKDLKLNLILDMIMSVSLILLQTQVYYYCFKTPMLNNMLIPLLKNINISNLSEYRYFKDIFDLSKYSSLLMSIYALATILLLYLNYPSRISNEEPKESNRGLILIRSLVFVPIAIVLIILYVV